MRCNPVSTLCEIAPIMIALAGCQQVPVPALPVLTPYKIDIQQGNVVTQDMVSKLKPGMTPAQVRFILGTPLVVDAFHKDRWDYVYRLEKRGNLQEHRRIVVVFADDKLARIEGDVVPAQPGSVTEGGVRIDKLNAEPVKTPDAQPARGKSGPGASKPDAPKAATRSADGAPSAPSGTGGAEPAQGKDAKPDEGEPKENKPEEERGFFGRILEKLGF